MLVEIDRADDTARLRRLLAQTPELMVELDRAGHDEMELASTLSSIGERLTCRLLKLAEAKLGDSPSAYAFVVAGSLARHEQILGADQDNGLVLGDDYNDAAHGSYFQALADSVCEGLADCGYLRCPGGIMASNRRLRKTLSEWQAQFRQWIENPEPEALLRVAIFFDLRCQYGACELVHALRGDMLERTAANSVFQAHLASAALGFRPGLGWFGRPKFVDDGQGHAVMDLKRSAITPVVDLARVHALSVGCKAISTLDRLSCAAREGAMSAVDAERLSQAFRAISRLRIAHQLRCLSAGRQPDYQVRRAELGDQDFKVLAGSLRAVRAARGAMVRRYRAEVLQ